MTLQNAFGASFSKDAVRTRSFDFGGHTFKVKVPLTAETESMFERIKNIDEDLAYKFYSDMAKEFLSNKDKYAADPDIEFKDNDIMVKGYSLRETARNKVLTQNRVIEMFKLLVPENKDFDMATISYADIEELFPFSVQLEIVEEISKVISPNYTTTRGK
jgi:hypothetical protein